MSYVDRPQPRPWALAILSLLRQRPMHPYEMRRQAGSRRLDGGEDARLRSLYHSVDQLRRAALIEPVETVRQGRRPQRTVYRITERGEHELLRWLRDLLATPVPEPARFLTALAYLHQLTPEEARLQLEARAASLATAIVRAAEPYVDRRPGCPSVVETDYERVVRRAELHWLHSLIDDLRSGRVTWTAGESRRRPERPAASQASTSRSRWASPNLRLAGGGDPR